LTRKASRSGSEAGFTTVGNIDVEVANRRFWNLPNISLIERSRDASALRIQNFHFKPKKPRPTNWLLAHQAKSRCFSAQSLKFPLQTQKNLAPGTGFSVIERSRDASVLKVENFHFKPQKTRSTSNAEGLQST